MMNPFMTEKKKKNRPFLLITVWCLLSVIISYFCVSVPDLLKFGGFNAGALEYVGLRFVTFRYACPVFILLFFALLFLFRTPAVPAFLLPLAALVFGVANYNMVFYRGTPFLPSDLEQISDAAIAVQEGFHVVFPDGMLQVLMTTVGLTLVSLPFSIRKPESRRTFWTVLFALLALLSLVLCYFYFSFVLMDESLLNKWGRRSSVNIGDIYYMNGFFPEFFAQIGILMPKAPSGYSAKEMARIGEMIRGYDGNGEPVDIIILQVESWQFVDNYDIQLEEDVFENYHRLAEEGVTGLMVSPKYGGGTANIEYEVLTGFSSDDASTTTTPFNNGLFSGFPGIVDFAADAGYHTIALHAYTSDLYNRPNAYRMLGFQDLYFSDSFVDPEMCGPWISDPACARKMIELYEEALSDGAPILIHGLTMQNHLPMQDDRFSNGELVTLTSDTLTVPDQFVMRRFCTALKWTDQALKILTDYFRTVDRKVILLAYGDHQTSIYESEELGDVLHHTDFYENYSSKKDFLKLHTTPYIVWANFGSENGGTTFGLCAPNELLADALTAYGVNRPAYWTYFASGVDSYRGVTSNYLITNDDTVVFSKSAAQQKEYNIRMLIQYDVVFGEHYLLSDLYGDHEP